MRYSIDHVLEGIALHRGEELQQLQAGLQAATQKLEDDKAKRAGGPRALEEVLRVQGTYLVTLRQLTRDDFQRVTSEVTRLERSLPTQYDVDNQARKLAQLQQDLDQLPAVGTTRLEQFLQALQAGGETHVSQHSLKQSGFSVEHLVTVVLARAAAHQGGQA